MDPVPRRRISEPRLDLSEERSHRLDDRSGRRADELQTVRAIDVDLAIGLEGDNREVGQRGIADEG